MDQKGHHLVKRWALSVKHLELPKLRPRLLLVNESKKEGLSPISKGQFQSSPNHFSKRNKQSLFPKGSKHPKRKNQWFATSVERLAINLSNATQNKKLMSYFWRS